MRSARIASLSFIASFLTVSSAFAAGMIQKVEPMNGFTRGENPEWMTINTDSRDFDMRHRDYQRDAEAERVLWLRTHESMMGTPSYAEAKREFHQHRNLMHRMWILQQTRGMKMRPQTAPVVPTIDLTPETSISTRTFTGNAPSRREIVRWADDRNKTRSISVGY